jgi:hypothetical protein
MQLPRQATRWSTKRVAAIAVAAALASLPVLFVGWLLLGDRIDDWIHRRPFDASVWKNQRRSPHDSRWPPRLCMVDDLLSSGRLHGMTKTQVTELLGPPDSTGFFGFSYYLGPERGFIGIDSETLIIGFDADEKLSVSQIHRD